MRLLLAAVLALAATPVAAQSDIVAEAQALIDTAIAEQTVFINCSATEPSNGHLVREAWKRDVGEALPRLRKIGVSPEAIADFERRADPETIMMNDRPYSEVLALCTSEAEGDWVQRYYRLQFVVLELKLQALLDGKAP